MVSRELSFKEFRNLSHKGITVIGDRAFKICPDNSEEVFKVIEAFKLSDNKDILLPDELLYFGGIFAGFGMEYLDGYITVGDALLDGTKFNRWDVINRVLDVMFYMLEHGIVYVDMHVFNVLIKDDDVKVIDIADVSLDESDSMCYGMIDFIFNTLYGDNIMFFRLKNLMSDTRFNKYFSDEFREYVKLIYDMKKDVDPREVKKYLYELQDEEKNKALRKIVAQMYEENVFKNRV